MRRFIIIFVLYCLVGWWLCDIDPMKEYTWYSGIWHGFFFVANFIKSWFTDAIYKAEIFTTAYNIFHWIFSILSVLWFFLRAAFRT